MKNTHVRKSPAGGQANPVNDKGLKGAIDELRSQHKIAHDDLGPHQGREDHVRHEPLHGLRPCK